MNITPIVEHVGFELTDKIGHEGDGDGGDLSDWDLYHCGPYVEERESPLFRRLVQRTVVQIIVVGSKEQPIRMATATRTGVNPAVLTG